MGDLKQCFDPFGIQAVTTKFGISPILSEGTAKRLFFLWLVTYWYSVGHIQSLCQTRIGLRRGLTSKMAGPFVFLKTMGWEVGVKPDPRTSPDLHPSPLMPRPGKLWPSSHCAPKNNQICSSRLLSYSYCMAVTLFLQPVSVSHHCHWRQNYVKITEDTPADGALSPHARSSGDFPFLNERKQIGLPIQRGFGNWVP